MTGDGRRPNPRPAGEGAGRALAGEAMPGLPRQEGEPVFANQWEAHAFALVMLLHQRGAFQWPEFRARLVAEIAHAERTRPEEDSGAHYYERWLAAFEHLLAAKGILTPEAVARREAELPGPAPAA